MPSVGRKRIRPGSLIYVIMLPYLDAHCHLPSISYSFPLERKIFSLSDNEYATIKDHPLWKSQRFSIGIHPREIHPLWKESLEQIESIIDLDTRIVAIGEAGMDSKRYSSLPLSLQQEVFEKQWILAYQHALPLIIHNVGTSSLLTHLSKRLPHPPMLIIHGFSGKEQEAKMLLRAGFHLSFGKRRHIESLVLAWKQRRLLLESDIDSLPIRDRYEQCALELGISTETLRQDIALVSPLLL